MPHHGSVKRPSLSAQLRAVVECGKRNRNQQQRSYKQSQMPAALFLIIIEKIVGIARSRLVVEAEKRWSAYRPAGAARRWRRVFQAED